jgi:Phage tail tube protein
MTTHIGNEGTIKVGGVVVGEFRTITVTETADTVEDTVTGDAWKTRKVTQKDFSASCDALLDPDDAAQGACSIGAEVVLSYYPVGGDSGDKYKSGNAIVTKREVKGTYNGLVEISFGFDGNGALAETTI